MKKIISKIFTSIWFITIIISIVIFAFTYQNFKEFSIEKIKEEGKNYDDYRSFCDVDNDSIDDKVDIKFNQNLKSKELVVSNSFGKNLNITIVKPFSLPKFYAEPFLFNFDNKGTNIMAHLLEHNDSIFIGYTSFDTLPATIFLDTIFSIYLNSPNTYDYNYFGTFDANQDGFQELYLYIAEGYRVYPRRLYCIDFHNKKLLHKSKLFGAFPVEYEQFTINDLPYFVVGSQATANMINFPDDYLSDADSYFMVFNKNLEFQFEPIKMGGNASRVHFFQKEINKQECFLVFANPYDESKAVKLKLINLKGNIIKEYEFAKNMKAIFGGIFNIENNIFYIDKNFKYHKFNFKTEKDEILELNFAPQPFWLASQDIDNDGKNEHLFRDKASNKIFITRNNFSKPTHIELPLNEVGRAKFYFPTNTDNKNIIFVWTYTKYYTFEYVRDKFYLIKLLGLLIVIFTLTFAFVWLIFAVLKYRLKQQMKITSRIKELEFQNVRNQMNPHFILNTLNFISTSVLKNEKEKTYDVITGFSNIIRSTLLDSNKILRSLEEELNFVNDYLKIQKHRFDEKFNFEINKHGVDIKNVKTPPFIIQIFVENSLKHGLKNIQTGGLILNWIRS